VERAEFELQCGLQATLHLSVVSPMWLPVPETRGSTPRQLRIDVSENEKEYQVLAELPGAKKEQMVSARPLLDRPGGIADVEIFIYTRRRSIQRRCSW